MYVEYISAVILSGTLHTILLLLLRTHSSDAFSNHMHDTTTTFFVCTILSGLYLRQIHMKQEGTRGGSKKHSSGAGAVLETSKWQLQ